GHLMQFAGVTEATQQLEGVGVVDEHLVLLGVYDVDEAIFGVDGNSVGINEVSLDLVEHLPVLIENEHATQLAVGDEDAAIVVNRNAVDPTEGRFEAVANQLGVASLGVEHEYGADFLVRNEEIAFRSDRHAEGPEQLKRHQLQLASGGGLNSGKAVHP